MWPTVDEAGFAVGEIAEWAINADNAPRVVLTLLPDEALGVMQGWRWTDGAWTATTDYRGHSFYNPEDTTQEHNPQAFDDAPPTGWTWWAPGENKIVGEIETLARARQECWERIKRDRAEATAKPLQTPYGVFDAHEEGVNNISRSVLLANNMVALGLPVAINFTLADNTTVTLNAMQMVMVGLLLGQQVLTVRGIATALRAQIYAEENNNQARLDTIVWPT
jgi:hypothetical protein